MKIKRYYGNDMRQVLRMVREEQGPDAVILSNRRVDGGVEIVAATDYDESLIGVAPATAPEREAPAPAAAAAEPRNHPGVQVTTIATDAALGEVRREMQALRDLMEQQLSYVAWSDFERRDPARLGLVGKLLAFGLSPELSRELAEAVTDARDLGRGWQQAMAQLAQRLPVGGDDVVAHGGVVALVGPTGVGKTTTIAKLAARYALRHGARHVALITTDNYRVGAHEQLRTYGRILNIPVRVAADAAELAKAVEELTGRGLILIDTAGMSPRDMRLAEQFAVLAGAGPRVRSHLVLAATAQAGALHQAVRAFSGVALDGCILTKLDECNSLGGALDVLVRRRLAVNYVSDGQRVPEDLHPARAEDLVSRGGTAFEEQEQVETNHGLLPLMMGRKAVHAY